MKKILVFLTALLFITGTLFAAGDKEESGTDSGEAPVLTVWAVVAAEIPTYPDQTATWQTIEEKVGVDLEWEMISNQAKDQNFNLLMAGGDLPHIIAYYEGKGGFTSINRFGAEGAFHPINQLIKKYQAPSLSKYLIDQKEVYETMLAQDENIYVVPMMSAINAARGWFIRYDWLDTLGLNVPTTTDELYDVLVAFRDQDPNQNGKADEVPLIFRRRGDDAFYNLQAFAYSFDADMDWVDRNGRVVYGPSEPQYQQYLEYINKLYSEKLIDQEILTRQGNPRTELFTANRAGAIHDWFASTSGLNDSLGAQISGFNLRHMPPPVGTAGEPFTRIQMSLVRQDGGWAISKDNPDLKKTIDLFDFVYSDEGQILTNFGVEGNTWTMEDGIHKYTDKITNNPEGLSFHEALVANGMQWKIGMRQALEYEMQFANEIAFSARKDYMENYIVDPFPVLSFTEEENETITDLYSQIRAYTLETTAKMMTGARPVSDFPKFVQELKDIGLDELTAIYQKAYDRKF
jgi:putative aldouronate transport system substrate-binding protein